MCWDTSLGLLSRGNEKKELSTASIPKVLKEDGQRRLLLIFFPWRKINELIMWEGIKEKGEERNLSILPFY